MHSLGGPCSDMHLGHLKNINCIELKYVVAIIQLQQD